MAAGVFQGRPQSSAPLRLRGECSKSLPQARKRLQVKGPKNLGIASNRLLMEPASTDLIYLYGVVGADAPDPPGVRFGIDDTPVRLLRVGKLAAIVSDVSRETY